MRSWLKIKVDISHEDQRTDLSLGHFIKFEPSDLWDSTSSDKAVTLSVISFSFLTFRQEDEFPPKITKSFIKVS